MVTSHGEGLCIISEPPKLRESRPGTNALANGLADTAPGVLTKVQTIKYGKDRIVLQKHQVVGVTCVVPIEEPVYVICALILMKDGHISSKEPNPDQGDPNIRHLTQETQAKVQALLKKTSTYVGWYTWGTHCYKTPNIP
jgi:hypothetical protein